MISLKTKYALKALIALAEEKARGGGSLTIEEIAERGGAPKRFLEHILLEIKQRRAHRQPARPRRAATC